MSLPRLNLNELTPDEKLRLLEELWESLSARPDVVPLSSSQRDELDRRLDRLDQEGPTGIPWDDVLRKTCRAISDSYFPRHRRAI